jgi:hypothetical protein
MDQFSFKDWFTNVFLVHVNSLNCPNDKKLLIFDGHSSLIHIDIVKLALQNNVIIVCLPPHSTHILQPLDVCVFSSIKTSWSEILEKENNSSCDVDKALFPKLLKMLVDNIELTGNFLFLFSQSPRVI